MLVREAQPCPASLSWCAVFRLVWVQHDRTAHCPVPRNVGFAPRCVHAFVPSLQASRRLEQLMCFFLSLQPCKKCQNVGVKLCNPVRGMPDLLPGLVLHHGVLAFSTYMLTAPMDFAELLASVAARAIGSQCLA